VDYGLDDWSWMNPPLRIFTFVSIQPRGHHTLQPLFFVEWIKRTKAITRLHIVPMSKNVCCFRCREVVFKHKHNYLLGVLTQTSKLPNSCNQSLPWVLLRLSYTTYHFIDSSPATRIQFISLMLGTGCLRESGSFALQQIGEWWAAIFTILVCPVFRSIL
jgi:hypothetical protein